jgi:2-succinyl-5-enolpyruvyl-6-hydroxy-3-cyclohexene-1-carboxylate synthase
VLYVGNSMPVRDLDSFFPGSSRIVRILGNRGASGIDGLVSSALGVAAAQAAPVVLVLGDLAFYHDMNGLLAAKLHRLHATIVVLNNDGGGIFSFLPQAAYSEHFETLFGTPHGLDFSHAAAMYGATHAPVGTWDAFRSQVRRGIDGDGVTIVEVRTARDRNVVLHREMWAAAEEAVAAEPALIGRIATPGGTAPDSARGSG